VFYLKTIPVSGFDFFGNYLAVALGCKVLKAHEAACRVYNVLIYYFYRSFLAGKIVRHLFEKC